MNFYKIKKTAAYLPLTTILLFTFSVSIGQNPFIRDQYTADPTARVFNGRVYVYPSHDILATPGKGRMGWFVMEDYHVFSSENLTDWTDHGVIVSQTKVPWARPDGYSMWAPDCIFKNGKYFFFFPTMPKDTTVNSRGFNIGVAVADKPEGPFVPESQSIKKVRGIDPNILIDKDGKSYLYWSAGNIFGAPLKDNMVELASDPVILKDFPEKGLKEGPYVFERKGIYYMTYPHVENKIERLEYAISDNPMGPFKFTGVIMDESPTGCWTNHQSIVEYKNQWYLFYHHNDYSPKFDKNRSIRVDSLFFSEDGTIRKVTPTLRGIGLTKASAEIQIDRFSKRSESGTSITFMDSLNRFKGWKTGFNTAGSWIQYNSVDFGNKPLKTLKVKAQSAEGGTLQMRTGSVNGPIIAEIKIDKSTDWKMVTGSLNKSQKGIINLFILLKEGNPVEVDLISFE